ncbi:ABC transporter permease [Nocardioides cavernaquae]|uniref:ABC transporter permease n=1 Tax=Nocardioides cavernaquae TaxID=2321396 RepID=A0A3A5HB47_9ACTN|nr:ABC transporter permease [Nocardioides cavernaquae]RJS47532.1 ABC transporter permease [Nocardioides cavernaquae]
MQLRMAEAAPPAGGAAFGEILIAAGMAGAVILFFAWVTLMERTDRPNFVGKLADWAARISGVPRWVALPVALGLVAIVSAGFGVWWDVPIHMQNGRDEGPLANPSHYFIFAGILGFCHAGILSMALAKDPLPRYALKLAPTWRVPLGAVIITGAGVIALIGFPADDLWHRLFGQDVTEWGPTHVMMIGGAVTFVLGVPVLLAEAAQVGSRLTKGYIGRVLAVGAMALCGIPFAFLMEFDLGVPQFPAATQFLIFGFLAAWILIAARLWMGPGGAALVSVLYLAIHGFLWLSVDLLPDVLTARFLLLVPSAVIIEVVAAVMQPKRRDHPELFAVIGSLLVGSLGMYAEWLWSKEFMPLPQPFNSEQLPFLLSVSTIAALGGGLLALWLVARIKLIGTKTPPVGRLPFRGFGLAGMVIFVVLMGIFGVPKTGDTYHATLDFEGVETGEYPCEYPSAIEDEPCLRTVTVKFDGKDAADGAVWFYALSWQGRPKGFEGEVPRDPEADVPGIVRSALVPTGTPGEYRSEYPVPLYGNWKTLLRLHRAPNQMVSFPLYAPHDEAITSQAGQAVHIHDGDRVSTILEKKFLQRETRDDVPKWWFDVGYGVVIVAWLALLLFYGWCYNRAAGGSGSDKQKRKETGAP